MLFRWEIHPKFFFRVVPFGPYRIIICHEPKYLISLNRVILFFMIQILLGSIFTLIQIRTKLFYPKYINEMSLFVINFFLLTFPLFLFWIGLIRKLSIKSFSRSTLRNILLGIISLISLVLIQFNLTDLFPVLFKVLDGILKSEVITSIIFYQVVPIILFDLILVVSYRISKKNE